MTKAKSPARGIRRAFPSVSPFFLALSQMFDFNPEIQLKPLEPTGAEGAKADAERIASYWRAVGGDISKAVERYGRKEK